MGVADENRTEHSILLPLRGPGKTPDSFGDKKLQVDIYQEVTGLPHAKPSPGKTFFLQYFSLKKHICDFFSGDNGESKSVDAARLFWLHYTSPTNCSVFK